MTMTLLSPAKRRATMWLAFCVLAIGCGEGRLPSASSPQPPVLTEGRVLKAEQASKDLGQDCNEFRASECRSGLCLHVAPGRGSGYLCSSSCKVASECPKGWTCEQMFPESGDSVCVPPENQERKQRRVRREKAALESAQRGIGSQESEQ